MGYNHRFGMVGARYGSETTMILNFFLVFVQRIKTPVSNLHFSILTMF